MVWLYNFFLILLSPFVYFALLVTREGKIFLKNRKNLFQDLDSFVRPKNSKVYWFHAASLGELEQCKSIIECIQESEKDFVIVQSVYSSSVSRKHLESKLFDFAFYLPLDFAWNYKKLFEKFEPNYLIIAAWDTWFNFLRKAKEYKCKTYLVCATINPNSRRLKFPFSFFTKKIFSYIDFILPANELFIKDFEKLVAREKIGISADSRFDAVINKIEKRNTFPTLPKTSKKIIILASTYREDEELLFTLLPNLSLEFSIWIFPHKLDEKNLHRIEESLKKMNLEFQIYSKANLEKEVSIVLFDKLGILAHAYERGFYTYVGGALHNRVHNIIEPAYFGLPILTGPKISHSAEARVLKEKGGLFIIQNPKEFLNIHTQITTNVELHKEIQKLNREFVQSMKSSNSKIYSFIKKL